MSIEEIYNKVKNYYGELDFNVRNRNQHIAEARKVFIVAATKEGYHPTVIANLVGIHRTTVIVHRDNCIGDEYFETRAKEAMNQTFRIEDITEQIKYAIIQDVIKEMSIDEVRELAIQGRMKLDSKKWKGNSVTKVYECSTGISHLVR